MPETRLVVAPHESVDTGSLLVSPPGGQVLETVQLVDHDRPVPHRRAEHGATLASEHLDQHPEPIKVHHDSGRGRGGTGHGTQSGALPAAHERAEGRYQATHYWSGTAVTEEGALNGTSHGTTDRSEEPVLHDAHGQQASNSTCQPPVGV